MRLVRYEEKNGKVGIGVKSDNGVIPVNYNDMENLIRDGEKGMAAIRAAAESGIMPIREYRLLAPIVNPGKILCSGINYTSHKDENPEAVFPSRPSVFAKLPSSIIGPEEDIVIPAGCSQVDYEVELAFVIGQTARNVKSGDAIDHIFGYTIVNDVSERELQRGLQHEIIGKGIDTFCPLGPEVVLKDEIPDPSSLRLAAYLNGETMQSASTNELLFDIPALVEFITSYITLNPGDIVSTGTPAGTGLFRSPQVFMKHGDVIEVEVERIGRLRNRVVAG